MPSQKEKNNKQKKGIFWNLLILLLFIFVVLNLVFIKKSFEYANVITIDQITLQKLTDTNNTFNTTQRIWTKLNQNSTCPDSRGGDTNSYLTIKYFYSKFCPWCIKEEPILNRLIKNYGNFVNIEWYNVKNCPELVTQYKVSGVPTFVLSTPDNQTEYNHYGFIPEKDLIKFVCAVTGECNLNKNRLLDSSNSNLYSELSNFNINLNSDLILNSTKIKNDN